MKPLALLTALLLFPFLAKADAGGCVVYKAKYVLKNGQTITGLLPLYGYEDYAYLTDNEQGTNKFCNDKAFQQLINDVFFAQQGTLNFDIYTAIYPVRYGKTSNPADDPNPFNCAFTDSSSVVTLNLDSIQFTVFLKAEVGSWDYPSVGLEIFDVQTSRMMQQKEVFNHCGLGLPPEPEQAGSDNYFVFEEYTVLNYNSKLSYAALKAKMERLLPQLYAPELKYVHSKAPNKAQQFGKEKQEIVMPLILQLRKEGIVLIPVANVG